MPNLWSFRYYVANGRKGDVKAIHDAGSPQLRAKFRSRIQTLGQLGYHDWREPLFKQLTGDGKGLGEVRFLADKVQQRPLGFVSRPNEFTLLLWATEKNDRFVPVSACATALKWKAITLADRNATNDIWCAL